MPLSSRESNLFSDSILSDEFSMSISNFLRV